MRNHFLKMTRKCERLQDLKSLSADCFVTGSDQVWGPTMNGDFDEAYFLSFASHCRKIAYAASFGKTQFTENTVVAYEKLLKRYNAIAVREDSAVKMLNEWQIPCEGQVLDPTLMMTGEEWCQFIDKDIDGQYVLVYQLHNNPKLCDYANDSLSKLDCHYYEYLQRFTSLNGVENLCIFQTCRNSFLL